MSPTETPASPRAQTLPIGMIVVLALTLIPYAGMLACLGDLQAGHSDAMGRGLAAGFGVLFGFVVWVALVVLLIIGGVKGRMPNWAAIACVILLPLSAGAAAITVDFIDHRMSPFYIMVPALIPLVTAGYALWARLPRLHRTLPPHPTSAVALGILLLLTAMPAPQFIADEVKHAARVAEQKAEEAAAEAKERAKREEAAARFRQLRPDAPLWEWAAFFGKDSELDADAITAAKALSHRQSDAEEALRRGLGFPLIEYARLDLEVTPGLCTAAGSFLRQNAAAHPSPGGDPMAAYEVIRSNFDPYLDASEWLTQHDCDAGGAYGEVAKTIALYPGSSSRDGSIAYLAWRQGNGYYKRGDKERALARYSEAVRLRPDNAQIRKSRGDVYFDQSRYDDAIADYDSAIHLNPGYSEAYYSRGNCYDAKREDDKAIASFDEAIDRAPGFAAAYNNRGNVYLREGNLDHAIDDYAEAIRHAPKLRVALANRGRARFYQGAWVLAADDLAAAVNLNPDDVYTVLWLYLARLRAGRDARDTLPSDAAKLDHAAWPYPIVAALLGDKDTRAILVEASADGNPERRGQACEAEFYFGAKAAAEGDPGTARDLLQRAASSCPADFIERSGADYELARLGK